MSKYFDENGEEITEGIFTQAELDAKIEEAKKSFVPEKKEEVSPVVEKKTESDDVLTVLKTLQDTVSGLVKSTETTRASKFTASLDDEKKTLFDTQFEALQKTGLYENTPEGIEKRAAAAYTLTTGESFDAGNMNMQNLSAIGGKAPTNPNKELSEADKGIAAALGNTEDDYKKYGGTNTST